MNDQTQPKINEREISHDFKTQLLQENLSEDPKGKIDLSPLVRPRCNVSLGAAGVLVRAKNALEIKALSKDLNPEGVEIVRDCLKTTPQEIELYKKAIDESFDLYGSPEIIDTLNKWAGSPILLIIEHEIAKIALLRSTLNQSHKKTLEVES